MTNSTLTITEKEHSKLVGILGRESEISHYQLNIDNHVETLKSLPQDDWPEDIAQYKKFKTTQKIAKNVPDADMQRVSDYSIRDHIKFLKKTEELEQRKAQAFYDGAIAAIKKSGSYDDDALNTKLLAKKSEIAAR